ncbi:MAG TPA: topoisomerase [Methylothermaceae bacterium]|nr:topoisomerase [Methylothermaceae bacterium]
MHRIVSIVLLFASLSLTSPLVLAININKADAAAIAEELKGIGKAKAKAIVKEREKHGPFKNSADLIARVKGIGPATVKKNEGKLQFK